MSEPPWVEALRHADVQAMGLRWLSDEEAQAVRQAWTDTWRHARYDEGFVLQGLARIERCQPLLAGPEKSRRLSKRSEQLVVVLDPAESDVAWLSLSASMPPQAWADTTGDAPGIGATITAYTSATDRRRVELPRTEVLVKEMELDGIDIIQRTVEVLEPWMDDAFWGSAAEEDPYAHLDHDAGVFLLRMVMERAQDQHHGRATSISVRSLWSRSLLTVEQHPYGFWRYVLRYAPFTNRRAIEKLAGDQPGSRFPADLPVDLASSLMRGASLTREGIGRDLSTAAAGDLLALWLLEGDRPNTLGTFREALRSWRGEDRHVGLVNVCNAVGLTGLLQEAALDEGESAFGDSIRNVLRPQAEDPDEGATGDDDDDRDDEEDGDLGDEDEEDEDPS